MDGAGLRIERGSPGGCARRSAGGAWAPSRGSPRSGDSTPRLQHLLAAEGEELAGQGRRALAGLLDLFDVAARRSSSVACRSQSSSHWKAMAASRLLKEWAMPPASRPTASMRCEWRSRSSLVAQRLLGGLGAGDVADGPAQPRRPVLARRGRARRSARRRTARGPRGLTSPRSSPARRRPRRRGRAGRGRPRRSAGVEVDGERLARQQVLGTPNRAAAAWLASSMTPLASVTR